ncbi:MAG: hypothetical protein PHV82_12125 [Victivallaceae bacterium]|nr:hypothetical protein [Victivallaceae bacterium]
MDIAIDYYHAGVRPEMFIDSSSRRKRGFIMEGDKYETINLGSNNSPVHYTIYDKQAEMRKIIDMPYCCRVEGKFTKDDNVCFCFSDFKKSQVEYSLDDKKFIYFGGSFMPFGNLEFGGNIVIPSDASAAQIMFSELMNLNAAPIIRRKLPRATFQRYKSWFYSLPRRTGIIHSPQEIIELCFSDLMRVFWGKMRLLYNDFVIDDELSRALKKGIPLSKLGNPQKNNH